MLHAYWRIRTLLHVSSVHYRVRKDSLCGGSVYVLISDPKSLELFIVYMGDCH
jgi:hypothetical protein